MTAVDPQFQKAMDQFRSADGIVIDLRGNPGGLAAMIMGLAGHFVSERATLGVMKTRQSEMKFPANPRLVNAAGDRVEPYKGPVAILVDGMTGSASECFSGGLQSLGRARVFGQTSMGQALPALFDRLPNVLSSEPLTSWFSFTHAVNQGAAVIRTHDVKETADFLKMAKMKFCLKMTNY